MKSSVALVSGAPGFSNKIDMENLISIQKRFHHKIHIYRLDPPDSNEGENIVYHKLRKPWGKGDNILLRILGILFMELHSLIVLGKLPKEVEYVFFLQSTQLFIPALFLLKGRTKIIKIVTRDYSKREMRPLIELIYSISDRIIVYTPGMIQKLDLESYEDKIEVWNYNYVGDDFKMIVPIGDRDKIGYIGRLAPEKNIGSIVRATKKIGMNKQLLIGGSGQSHDKVKKMCEKEGVKFIGEIPHKEMGDHLNRLKLLILPSDTEGFPKIVTEAMACGTIVLATPVGGIEDAIIDGETGFLLNSLSAEKMSIKIKEALERDDIDIISLKAYKKVRDVFSYENAVERYRNILKKI